MRVRLAAGLLAAGVAFAVIVATAGIEGRANGVPSAATVAADHESGRAVFARMGCGSCHTLAAAGSQGLIGPDLDARLRAHTRESLIATITDPASSDGAFSVMPDDFGSRMSAEELDALVGFLLAARRR